MSIQTFNVQAEFQGTFRTPLTTRAPDIVVHHAAWLYPQYSGLADNRAVRDHHVNTMGWGGEGYHVTLAEIIQGGPIGRYNIGDLAIQRAHIAMQNHRYIGVSCLTDFDKHANRLPEQKWFDALVEVLRDLLKLYPSARIVGHKEAALAAYPTACPGSRWLEWKPRLLRETNAVLLPLPAPTLPAGAYPVDMKLLGYWQASGGLWLPDRFAPGHAITPLHTGADGNQYQLFERTRLRRLPASGRIEALLSREQTPAFI